MAEILNFKIFLQKVDFWKTFSETDFSFWGYTFPFLSFIFLVFALPLALYSNIDQKSYWRKREKMSGKSKIVKTSKCDFYTKRENEYWCDHCDFKVNGKEILRWSFLEAYWFLENDV